jgi:hypothetical protein
MPKGERVLAQSKRTAPPPIFFKKRVFQLVWFFNLVSPYVQKGGENSIFKINISKPSWTLRGGFHLGGVLFSQRKIIWNKGRKFQILKMLHKILFIYLWLFAKELWKRIYKRICKNKTCGASVVRNIKNKEAIHAYIISIYIGSIPSNLCTYIMQSSSIMHFYTCFGLCWHQSPKRGRLKGN